MVPLLEEMTADDPGDAKESMFLWSSDSLTFGDQVETEVTYLGPKMSICLYFNDKEENKLSFTQTLYIKREGTYRIVPTSDVELGDYLITVSDSGEYGEELVESISQTDEPEMTYLVGCEPQDWFVAGGYLMHNK